MIWQIFTVICFFGITPQPLCVYNGNLPLYFDNKNDCKNTTIQIQKVLNKPLLNRKTMMVMYCEPMEKENGKVDT
tara:strand:- start:2198 stop:2422 length:225 start_codon:yes stop_codon:yes gene_type:complete